VQAEFFPIQLTQQRRLVRVRAALVLDRAPNRAQRIDGMGNLLTQQIASDMELIRGLPRELAKPPQQLFELH
jgi:hypothetical protein